MATLASPGVLVSVTDEALYTSAGPGTVPLIFIATAENKASPDGTGVAAGTLATNANKLYTISSRRELLQTFGDPNFNEVGGSAQHGYPLNEYGLLAAYSYLGIANRAFIVRADIDLAELEPLTSPPTADPINNTYWLNTNDFVPGLFEWDDTASEWVAVDVAVYLNDNDAAIAGTSLPNAGFVDGDFLASFDTQSTVKYFKREGGLWLALGTGANDFQWSSHTQVPTSFQSDGITPLADGDLWLKTTSPNDGLQLPLSVYDAEANAFVDTNTIGVYADHAAYYSSFSAGNVSAGTVVAFDETNGSFVLEWHNGESDVAVTGSVVFPTAGITTTGAVEINTISVAFTAGDSLDDLIQAINTASIPGVVANKTTNDRLIVTNNTGEDLDFANATGSWSTDTGIAVGTYSNFAPVAAAAPAYVAADEEPTVAAPDGTYWYNPTFDVDLMVNDGSGGWIDFPNDVYVQSSEPLSVATGDLWIDTDQAEDYPVIFRWDGSAWVLIDNTDQTTTKGIVFADARTAPGAALDADAPEALLYPEGLLLWNTRYSGRNVKVFRENYTFNGNLIGDRWVSASGNREDGSPYTGLDAVKRVVVMQFASVMQTSEEIRADTIFYNLIAAPGFPELMDEMINLNLDRKEQAFVIGDTPFTLRDNSTELLEWATNANLAPTNGDEGLVSTSPYLGVYYPSGFTTNTDGSEVVVPASHMMLRVMAFNDQVAYPWFAPAGFARGTVTNATSVGYLDSENEFVPVTLSEGLRDVLYLNNVNPITFIPGRGLVVFGQKTRNPVESALDRVNVARLVNFLRFQSERIALPFLFEPNDNTTRDAVKNAFDTFLAELITLRALFDFLVVCDTSNNTPARIDRNELWVDIAIQPIKSVEFIYIPIRLQNTGADLS